VVLLAADPVMLARRLERSHPRPPLTQEPNLEAEMCALWRQREPIYRRVCDVMLGVDAQSDDEEADFQAKVSGLLVLLRPFLARESALS
jgi:shikimate kinase